MVPFKARLRQTPVAASWPARFRALGEFETRFAVHVELHRSERHASATRRRGAFPRAPAGSAIVYGSTTDNVTQDPSVQFARKVE